MVFDTFKTYLDNVDGILENIEHTLPTAYNMFMTAMQRVTASNGFYVLNPEDAKAGSIDLPDQGLKIVQIIFSDYLGLHYAVVSPGSNFCHGHSELSELHFVEQECPYDHFVDGKRFQVREADVVSMAPGIPHGGHNTSDKEEVTLYFIAGDRTYGPWRKDFDDRTNHPKDDLPEATDIQQLNGELLETAICRMLEKGFKTQPIISPYQCAGKTGYGIGLEAVHIGPSGILSVGDGNHIVKVWDGKGTVDIGGIETVIRRQDCFSIPSGISYSIRPNEGMILLKFGLYQTSG